MAIEQRTLPNGKVVGWDTKRKCYCPLPKDQKALDQREQHPGLIDEADAAITIPVLREIAEKEGIDLGNATRRDTIIGIINTYRQR